MTFWWSKVKGQGQGTGSDSHKNLVNVTARKPLTEHKPKLTKILPMVRPQTHYPLNVKSSKVKVADNTFRKHSFSVKAFRSTAPWHRPSSWTLLLQGTNVRTSRSYLPTYQNVIVHREWQHLIGCRVVMLYVKTDSKQHSVHPRTLQTALPNYVTLTVNTHNNHDVQN